MASSGMFSGSDVKFLLTFVAGMGAFWLSGHLPRYIPMGFLGHNRMLLMIVGLVLALVIYGLCLFVWSWLMAGRQLKAALIATSVGTALALATSLTLTYTPIGSPRTKNALALLVFGLYLAYGIYFVISWFISRRLAKTS